MVPRQVEIFFRFSISSHIKSIASISPSPVTAHVACVLQTCPAGNSLKPNSLIRASSAGAKGQNILESLYPNSTQNAFQMKEIKHTYSSSGQDEKFTGYIPMEDLDIKYMKSGGPGGQNVKLFMYILSDKNDVHSTNYNFI
ncbi:hypothetical protein KUTeg_004320 [Tegillarca granosa]|uniref:Uncharacterized protein n=1 Tax=Tegillarca granosa TaxID=220873 RepID=A0ABQ9FPL1_TEGGR|nr:hypothetical protein KUTeg_004320 [Tegillarca granosa]